MKGAIARRRPEAILRAVIANSPGIGNWHPYSAPFSRWSTDLAETICIATFPNRLAAEVAKQVLEGEGIESFFTVDDAGGMFPGMDLSSDGGELFVLEDHADRAKQILRERLDESHAIQDE